VAVHVIGLTGGIASGKSTVARVLGLADLSTPKARATLCAQCHARSTRGIPFDPSAPVHPVVPLAGESVPEKTSEK
jgi:hypothetical protein